MKKKKIIYTILIILVVVGIGFTLFKILFNNNSKSSDEVNKKKINKDNVVAYLYYELDIKPDQYDIDIDCKDKSCLVSYKDRNSEDTKKIKVTQKEIDEWLFNRARGEVKYKSEEIVATTKKN